MKLAFFLWAFVCSFLVSALSWAQDAASAEPNLNLILEQIVQAIQSGKYVAAGAGVVLILTFLFRKFILPKIRFGNGILPIVSLLLGAILGIASNVLGGMSPDEAAKIVLLSGVGAQGLWGSFFKLFAKKD